MTPTNGPVKSLEILLVKVQNLTLARKITKYLGLLRESRCWPFSRKLRVMGDGRSKTEKVVKEAHKEAHMKDGWKVVRNSFLLGSSSLANHGG